MSLQESSNMQSGEDWELPFWLQNTTSNDAWPTSYDTLGSADTAEFQNFLALDPSLNTMDTHANTLPLDHEFTTPPLPSESQEAQPCELDPASCKAMSDFERSLRATIEQRPKTLPRRRSKYRMRTSIGERRASPITIQQPNRLDDPIRPLAMQRWQNSPPEDEPAPLDAIYNALENDSLYNGADADITRRNSAFTRYRGPSSTTSLDSAVSDSSLRSANSSRSALSQRTGRSAVPRSKSKKKKDSAAGQSERIFKCSFCCDTFKNKYDWSRHEKSLHLNTEEWRCTPNGPAIVLSTTQRVHCAYCSALDPTPEHLESHNHAGCQEGRSTPRTFRRKDHLVQHLRLVHGLKTLPLLDDWKVEPEQIKSRCGFCNADLNSWEERTDHLAAHFRQGKTMDDWSGGWGFQPAIEARLTNAYPPYLIAMQARTLVPFSATNHESLEHTRQLLDRIESSPLNAPAQAAAATPESGCSTGSFPLEPLKEQPMSTAMIVDAMSIHLGRFARQLMLDGTMPTDVMFQSEARRMLYGEDEDEWNQTVADDPVWLQEFKTRSGM